MNTYLVIYTHDGTISSMVACTDEASGRRAYDDAHPDGGDGRVQLWEVPVTDGRFTWNGARSLDSKEGHWPDEPDC